MSRIITDLLQIPFSRLCYEKKLEIVRSGRPQLALPNLKQKGKTYTRRFNVSAYKKYPWLTGSLELNKLYCWPCLLFSKQIVPWNSSGFNSLKCLVRACDTHQMSMNHIKAFTALQTFSCQGIYLALDLQKKIDDDLYNAKVKENRTILKHLINVVTFLGKQECAYGRHNESQESSNKDMYIELVQFLGNYNTDLAIHLKTATDFRGTSPSIQNDLIDAVADVISDKIKSEIKETTFVAVMLDECSDVTNKSQLSTVVRYVNSKGNCQERFLRFSDVSANRAAQGLFLHVSETVDFLQCSNKLVAQTFDGATVMAREVSDLQTLVKTKYPTASFIHCHNHRLSLVLSQSTYFIRECKRFFISLTGISAFFSNSTRQTTALENFLEWKHPELDPRRWNFSSGLVSTVREHRRLLIDFFVSIEDEPGDWRTDEVNTVSGFVRFLSRFDTVFFLVIFHRIFVRTNILFDRLQNKCLDISYCSTKIDNFCDFLQKMRSEEFDEIWTEATALVEAEEVEPAPKRRKDEKDWATYLHIFNAILDTFMVQMKHRFESWRSLKFVSLLDSTFFEKFYRTFPQELLMELKGSYAAYFDLLRLKNELRVFYSLHEYKNKSVTEIVRCMKLNSLDIVFSELYKLGQLILTFPSTTAEVERGSSALEGIKTYLRTTQGQVRLNNLALLSIEKTLLTDLKNYEESFLKT